MYNHSSLCTITLLTMYNHFLTVYNHSPHNAQSLSSQCTITAPHYVQLPLLTINNHSSSLCSITPPHYVQSPLLTMYNHPSSSLSTITAPHSVQSPLLTVYNHSSPLCTITRPHSVHSQSNHSPQTLSNQTQSASQWLNTQSLLTSLVFSLNFPIFNHVPQSSTGRKVFFRYFKPSFGFYSITSEMRGIDCGSPLSLWSGWRLGEQGSRGAG